MSQVDMFFGIVILLVGCFVLASMTMSSDGNYFQSFPKVVNTRYLFQKGEELDDPKLNFERDVFGNSFAILVGAMLIVIIAGVNGGYYKKTLQTPTVPK